jgi:hypothetical protein
VPSNVAGSPRARYGRVRRGPIGSIHLHLGRLDLSAAGVPATLLALVIATLAAVKLFW